MICDRCGKTMFSYIMSFFNTQNICHDCEVKERAHPLYEEAVRVETEACQRGEFNFPGIGLPADLK